MSPIQLLSLGFALGLIYLVAGIFSTAVVDNHTRAISRPLNNGFWALVIVLGWWIVLPAVCVHALITGQWRQS